MTEETKAAIRECAEIADTFMDCDGPPSCELARRFPEAFAPSGKQVGTIFGMPVIEDDSIAPVQVTIGPTVYPAILKKGESIWCKGKQGLYHVSEQKRSRYSTRIVCKNCGALLGMIPGHA